MKALWLAPVALLVFAATVSKPAEAEPGRAQPAATWSGAYIGGYVGWGHAGTKSVDLTGEDFGPPGSSMSLSDSGLIAGATLGYNFQRGAWVMGPEVEIGIVSIDKLRDVGGSGVLTDYGVTGSLALRLGYASGGTLLYGKGGAALAKIRSGGGEYDGPGSGQWGFDTNEAGLGEKVRYGWMIGAGIEQMISRNWSLKLEYTFTDFQSKTYTDPDGTGADFRFEDHLHSIKFGANYRF